MQIFNQKYIQIVCSLLLIGLALLNDVKMVSADGRSILVSQGKNASAATNTTSTNDDFYVAGGRNILIQHYHSGSDRAKVIEWQTAGFYHPYLIVASPDGRFLYVAGQKNEAYDDAEHNDNAGGVVAYERTSPHILRPLRWEWQDEQFKGNVHEINDMELDTPIGLVINPAGRVFVAGNSYLQVYQRDRKGQHHLLANKRLPLTSSHTKTAPTSGNVLVFQIGARGVPHYVAGRIPKIENYSTNNLALSLSGKTLYYGNNICLSPDGKFLCQADTDRNLIFAWSVQPSGRLRRLATLHLPKQQKTSNDFFAPLTLAWHPDHDFLYVGQATQNFNRLYCFSFNQKHGPIKKFCLALSQVAPMHIQFSPHNNKMYISDAGFIGSDALQRPPLFDQGLMQCSSLACWSYRSDGTLIPRPYRIPTLLQPDSICSVPCLISARDSNTVRNKKIGP